MRRISLLAGAMALGAASLMGQAIGIEQAPTVRTVSPEVTKRKKISGGKRRIGTSKYMPHIGKKEQERAKRLWESEALGVTVDGDMAFRCSPTLCQASKGSLKPVDL